MLLSAKYWLTVPVAFTGNSATPSQYFNYRYSEKSVEKRTMHAINWTNQLDDVFRENAKYPNKEEPDAEEFMWQYFGSEEGFVRHFPASRWTTPFVHVSL